MPFICLLSPVDLFPSGRISLQAELHLSMASTTELNSLCLILGKCSFLAFSFRSMLLFSNMDFETDGVHFHHEKKTIIPLSATYTFCSNRCFFSFWLTVRFPSSLSTSANMPRDVSFKNKKQKKKPNYPITIIFDLYILVLHKFLKISKIFQLFFFLTCLFFVSKTMLIVSGHMTLKL